MPTGSFGKRMHLKCILPVSMDKILRMTLLRGDMREVMSIQTSPHCTCGASTERERGFSERIQIQGVHHGSQHVKGTQCAEATSLACMSGNGISGEVCRNTRRQWVQTDCSS